jgi:hypothetical protein
MLGLLQYKSQTTEDDNNGQSGQLDCSVLISDNHNCLVCEYIRIIVYGFLLQVGGRVLYQRSVPIESLSHQTPLHATVA